MVSREIWINMHSYREFSKETNTSNSTRLSDSCFFEVFQKLTRACYIQIVLETTLLHILNTSRRIVFGTFDSESNISLKCMHLSNTTSFQCSEN